VALEMTEWMDRIFGRAVTPDFHRLIKFDEVCGRDLASLQRLTEVFENASTLLKPFSDESLNQSFWDLSSNVLVALTDESIEWPVRHRLIRSFETLFREVFAVRCRPTLGHLDEEGSRLNSACYMWWDFNCWSATPDPLTRNPLDTAYFTSMQSILAIDHVACQESALHGLGHWHRAHSAAVESIIDEFLERERHLRYPLREYAHSARSGCVL
jgi:hypothetical protein